MPSLARRTDPVKIAAAKERDAALRTSIDDGLKTLANAIDTVRASEQFEAYLRTQALFHDYSFGNCMMIYMQCPIASRVAGFQTWKKLKRFVMKGQKSIRILAPMVFKKKEPKSDGSDDTGVCFRCVSVFDVSQTEGEDLPTIDCPDITEASDTLLADLCSVTTSRGIALSFGTVENGAYGVSRGGSIQIAKQHSTGQQAKTLAHELAHEALHRDKDLRATLTQTTRELEAESVAYVVCRRFGLDCTVRSSTYVTLWGGDVKLLRASLDRISKAARSIIDEVETGRKAGKAVA